MTARAGLDEQVLADAVATVLERAAFVVSDWLPGERIGTALGPSRRARITIRAGGGVATVLICASDGFLVDTAASFLGRDPNAVDDATSLEMLLALTNMCAGEVVMRVGGAERALELGLPEIGDGPESTADVEAVLQSSGGRIGIGVQGLAAVR